MKKIISFFFCRISVLLMAVVLSACVVQSGANERPQSQPHDYYSANGVLTAMLEAKEEPIQVGDVMIGGMVYNDDYAGPVFHVHPGDVMKIKFVNHLSEPSNLHFHGYEGSPLGHSDNMYTMVMPGDSFDYEIKIPDFQPPGLYWYHAHMHGLAEKQIMSGLTGTWIVDGIEKQFPELADIKQQLFVLKEYVFDQGNDREITQQYHRILQSINGAPFTDLMAQPGETQLWRIANHSADNLMRLALKGHVFRVIAMDGVTMTKAQDMDVLELGPATRFDVLVDAGAAGSYDLLSVGVPTGSENQKSSDRILGRLTVAGVEKKPVPVPTAFPDRLDLSAKAINNRRTIVFTENANDGKYFLDGQTYDAGRIDVRVPLGTYEEWTLKNDTDNYHVFHIHQLHFQVAEINGTAQPLTGYLDTVKVPERGSVKIVIPFTNPLMVGKFVYHCHVLEHEDKGMMANIEVYDPNATGPRDTSQDVMPMMDMPGMSHDTSQDLSHQMMPDMPHVASPPLNNDGKASPASTPSKYEMDISYRP
jgi:suppressor of ftsI